MTKTYILDRFQQVVGLAIFFPGVTLYTFLLIYGGLGFWGWGHRLGFWGRSFQLTGFWDCGVRPSEFFRVGDLYVNMEE